MFHYFFNRQWLKNPSIRGESRQKTSLEKSCLFATHVLLDVNSIKILTI